MPHLRNVKIYVTMNTIVFENEVEEMKVQMQELNEIGCRWNYSHGPGCSRLCC